MAETVYGFTKFSECYHSSPNCPVLKHMERHGHIEMRTYASEEAATKQGHIRRCKQCMGDVVFSEAIEKKVRLTTEQYNTLQHIVAIHKKTKAPMALKHISERRKKSVVATHLIVKALMERGLVEKAYNTGSHKAKNKSIQPSELGLQLAESPYEA